MIHAIPGLPAPVEVFAGGSRLFAFDYGTCKGPLSLAPNTYPVEVRLNGVPVLQANVNLQADRSYTAIAHLGAAGGNTLTLFDNDISAIAAGSGRLVVRHTAAAPAVDVELTRNSAPVARLTNLINGNQVGADVAAGQYAAAVFPAGGSTPVLGPARVDVLENVVRVVYAIGSLANNSLELFLQDIDLDPPVARLTVIHGIPGLPAPVEVFANGAPLFSFDFRAVRGPLPLPPATYAVDVRLQGQSVLQASPMLQSGKSYTAVAHLLEGGAINLGLFENDATTPASGQARVTIRHLADAPAVDVEVAQNGQRLALIQNVRNGAETTASLAAGRYDVSLFAAGTSNRVFGPVMLDLDSRIFYGVHAVGSLSGNSFGLVVKTADLNDYALFTRVSGTTCGGAARASTSEPDFGKSFRLTVTGAAPNGLAMAMLGLSDTQIGSLALPLDLTRFGAAGCTLYTSSDAVLPMPLDANGNAGMTVAFPRSNTRRIWSVFAQFGTSTTGNALGAVFSELVTVGAQAR